MSNTELTRHLHTPSLPVLVDANLRFKNEPQRPKIPPKPDGDVCFALGEEAQAVREVREGALDYARALKGDRELFDCLRDLIAAFKGDEDIPSDTVKAINRLRAFLPTMSDIESWDLSGNRRHDGARFVFAALVSEKLRDAKLVMWMRREGSHPVSPALYCPDPKTAAFALLMRGSVKTCARPGCGKTFIPDPTRPKTKFHSTKCCNAHYRMENYWNAKDKKNPA